VAWKTGMPRGPERRRPRQLAVRVSAGQVAGADTPAAARPASNHSVIIEFLVDDVDGVHQDLAGFVGDFVTEPTRLPWGNRWLLLRDPDGNLVSFFTPLRRPPSESSLADHIPAARQVPPGRSPGIPEVPVPGVTPGGLATDGG
jgi:predicted enzyme related to lactoylglutathione lyase